MENIDFRGLASKFETQIKKIKVCAFDIDGILTNSLVFYDEQMGFNRFTNVHDGYGLKILMEAGYKVGVISGGESKSVVKRFQDNLKLDFAYLGNEDKRAPFEEILKMGYEPEEVLYMGDEFFDLPLLKRAGFSATVPRASLEIREAVDYVTTRNGGEGAAREVIDIIRFANNIVPKVLDFGEEGEFIPKGV